MESNFQVRSIQSHNNTTIALTSNHSMYIWGGKKNRKSPEVVRATGMPDQSFAIAKAVSMSEKHIFVLTEAGGVYSSRSDKKSFDWSLMDQIYGASSICSQGDCLYVTKSGTGKVLQVSIKSNDVLELQTIRVCDVACSSSLTVVCLAIYNQRRRIFGQLHPQPLLKLSTAYGMIEWLVKTGCKYTEDLTAFTFAFGSVIKLLAEERQNKTTKSESGISIFVNALRRFYIRDKKGEGKSQGKIRAGVVKLLQAWVDSKPPLKTVREVLNSLNRG